MGTESFNTIPRCSVVCSPIRCPSAKEIPGILSRPADIFLPNWQRGQPAALDVTVISTLQHSTLQGAASAQGHALVVGAERKLATHAVACRAAGIAFIPLVVESLGGWSNEAADIITKIEPLQGQRLGVPPAESTRHLFQRCAIALWRGNAGFAAFPLTHPWLMTSCN